MYFCVLPHQLHFWFQIIDDNFSDPSRWKSYFLHENLKNPQDIPKEISGNHFFQKNCSQTNSKLIFRTRKDLKINNDDD